MAVSPTNRYMNLSGTSWTPQAPGALLGTAISLTGIKSISYNDNFQVIKESSDFDVFPSVAGPVFAEPTFALTTLDAMALYTTIVGGTGQNAIYGVFAFTVRDFYNGITATGGAKSFSVSNSFLGDRSRDFTHRQLGMQHVTVHCYASDGATNPISISAM